MSLNNAVYIDTRSEATGPFRVVTPEEYMDKLETDYTHGALASFLTAVQVAHLEGADVVAFGRGAGMAANFIEQKCPNVEVTVV